jgi:hypothetical protein
MASLFAFCGGGWGLLRLQGFFWSSVPALVMAVGKSLEPWIVMLSQPATERACVAEDIFFKKSENMENP